MSHSIEWNESFWAIGYKQENPYSNSFLIRLIRSNNGNKKFSFHRINRNEPLKLDTKYHLRKTKYHLRKKNPSLNRKHLSKGSLQKSCRDRNSCESLTNIMSLSINALDWHMVTMLVTKKNNISTFVMLRVNSDFYYMLCTEHH